ncbi:MAG: transporter [Cephaloticoccus sp.]|nr:transporter [Cephaloticoccus sp.]MCF7760626.1 transporter [Cephaloticoccus sp.]
MKMGSILIGGLFLFWAGAARLVAQATEVTSTAPAGGWLWEIDILRVAVDNRTSARDGKHHRSTTLGSVLLSTGLTDRWDVQFGMELWRNERVSGNGPTQSDSSQGEAWLRTKWNFAGEEENGPAWALLPSLKLPVADPAIGNEEFEPGLVLIFARPINAIIQWHANLGVDLLCDGTGGRHAAIYTSTAVTRICSDKVALYGEFAGWTDLQDMRNGSGEVGVGVTYAFHQQGWMDFALYVGLTRAAPDYTPVLRSGWQF